MYGRLLLAAAIVAFLSHRLLAQSSGDAIERTLPRIVKIYGSGGVRGLYAYSTGFLVSSVGHLVTVWSHVLDAERVTVVLNDGRQFQAKVLGVEPALDLAVLKIDSEHLDLPHFDLEQAATAAAGTRILGFSNMFKVATGDEPVSVLHGVIASRTRLSARRGTFEIPYDGQAYIVDAITNNPGAGGGVITTRDGKLLGVIGKQLRNAKSNTWVNYAIPVTELRGVIKEILSGEYVLSEKKPDRQKVPNRYSPIDFGLVMLPDVLFRTPTYVDSIVSGSAAAKAGLRSDDLVLFVNDELVQSNRELIQQLGQLEAGDTLKLIVRRGTRLVSVEMPVHKKAK